MSSPASSARFEPLSRDSPVPLPSTSVAPSSTAQSSAASSPSPGRRGARQGDASDTTYSSVEKEDGKSSGKDEVSPGGDDGTPEQDSEQRWARLEFMLEKSRVYASLLKERMDRARANMEKKAAPALQTPEQPPPRRRGRPSKAAKREPEPDAQEEQALKNQKTSDTPEEADGELPPIEQPALITGTKLKGYQLEGLAWMASLYENGISGILADEMGLGKTLQTIAFNAFYRDRSNKPFLVVCPLSVLHNWADEFEKFAPEIPLCVYHGNPDERAELRRTVMVPASDIADDVWALGARPPEASTASPKPRGRPPKGKKAAGKPVRKAPIRPAKRKRGNDDDGEEQPKNTFPVVLTTYEMVIRDQKFLGAYSWGYIVVDEGHRLKNFDSRLVREIKKYESAGRMVLTGTPLQNNLAELWSLLNFVLPDIFQDLDAFQQWFNLPNMQNSFDATRSTQVVQSLHAILKPFLLRRLKADVETELPPKKEYVLYAPLTHQQREMYDAIVRGTLRHLLIQDKRPDGGKVKELTQAEVDAPRQTRKKPRKSYAVDEDDDEYFERLENPDAPEVVLPEEQEDAQDVGREWTYKTSLKKVNTMSLQNTVMQLRKVCSHPFLFDWPSDPNTHELVVNDQLVDVSGKMMVLERLLDALFARGHKVLIFSQFRIGLDVIEDWATEFKGWPLCRIDGETDAQTRRAEMARFQTGGDAPDAPRLFLLTTRAGGQGINLTAADTVIFYDQDWNPQMDAQAADRAHRIGQTKPVLIFRLVSKHTIEARIMQRATEKRQLEALVIAKGKFRAPSAVAVAGAKGDAAQDTAALLALEGEQIEVVPSTAAGRAGVLSDADLDALLDRSPEVFAERRQGWAHAKAPADGEKREGAAFAVFEAPVDTGNGALANMLGEEELPA